MVPGESVSLASSRSCPATSWGGGATMVSAKPLRHCCASSSGSDGGCAPSSGGSGSAGAGALRRCVASASTSTWRRKPPAVSTAHGGSATAPRSLTRYLTLSSPGLVSPLSDTVRSLKFVEPPCTDPYARWCGRGGAVRLPPIPIDGPPILRASPSQPARSVFRPTRAPARLSPLALPGETGSPR